MLNLASKGWEVGLGACGAIGWEGDVVDEPIHMSSCFMLAPQREVQTFSQQHVLSCVPGGGSI